MLSLKARRLRKECYYPQHSRFIGCSKHNVVREYIIYSCCGGTNPQRIRICCLWLNKTLLQCSTRNMQFFICIFGELQLIDFFFYSSSTKCSPVGSFPRTFIHHGRCYSCWCCYCLWWYSIRCSLKLDI